jgi:lysophospholipase L1-like esterase
MKRFFCLLLMMFPCLSAQNLPTFHSTYYDQKRTQHEGLPINSGTVVMLGDSITDMGEWQELTGLTNIQNRGISGDITLGVIDRLDSILQGKPAKIFLLIGINDIGRNIPDSTIIANHRLIVQKIKSASPRTKIYLQSILPTNNEFTAFVNHQNKTQHVRHINNELFRMATEERVTFVDLYSYFLDKEGKLDKRFTNDGLHLLGDGYQLWVRILRENKYL